MAEIPAELQESFARLDPALREGLVSALDPVSSELGPREVAVLQRLANGVVDGAPASELNAFVRLLPVTVSRAVAPALEPLTAKG